MASVSGATDAISSFAMSVAGGAGLSRALGSAVFDEVLVDSQFSPPIALQPFAPGDPNNPPGSPDSPLTGAIGIVRPRVRLMKAGQPVATFAPGGEPNGFWIPNAVGAGAAIASLTAFLLGAKRTGAALAVVSVGGFGLGWLSRPRA